MTRPVRRETELVRPQTGVNQWKETVVRRLVTKIERLQVTLAERRIPDLLAYGLTVFSIALGMTMVLGPEAYSHVVSFRPAFDLARAEVWGIAFVATGILLGVGFWRDRKSGQYAGVVMTALFAVFGFLAGQAPITGTSGGVWSGPLVYTFVAYVSMITVIACSAAEKVKP